MSFSFKLISHPRGGKDSGPKLLKDHLLNVGSIAREILNGIKISQFCINSKPVSNDNLLKLVYIVGISHDFGKSTTYFQNHIKNDGGSSRTELSYHSQISSLFGYYVTDALLKDKELAYLAYLSIYYHHGDLRDPNVNVENLIARKNNIIKQIEDIRNNSFSEVKEIYDILLQGYSLEIGEFLKVKKINDIIEDIEKLEKKHLFSLETSYDHYYLVMFIYSILLHADKTDAASLDYDRIAGERKKWLDLPPSIIDGVLDSLRNKTKKPSRPENSINSLRDKAFEDAVDSLKRIDIEKQRILTLELPTGLGKTLISYALALRIREIIKKDLGFVPRIIYSLPFLSIIDQNFSVIRDALSRFIGSKEVPTSLLLQHHHLSDIQFTFGKDGDSDTESYSVRDIKNRFLLMEGWNSEIIVTSFVQLFHTIITNRNASAMKLHNIANSIIILDEVQSIPYKYLMLAGSVFKYIAYQFNCWIILMTATMPLMFSESEVKPIISDSNWYFEQMDRVHYTRNPKPLKLKDMVDLILASDNKDIMVVMNTIRSSRELYGMLKEIFRKKKGDPDTRRGFSDFTDLYLVYISTAITPAQRKERIGTLRKKDDGKRRIAVTTQLIEAGVDLDFDIVIRDQAPLDSIIQAGGRANRNGEIGHGEVRLVSVQDDKGAYYANKVYDLTLLDASKEVLDHLFKDRVFVEEAKMHMPVMDYYNFLKKRKSDSESGEYIGWMKNIQFSSVGKFKLIEDDFPKADVFIPYDDRGRKIWAEYLKIKSIKDPISRWESMLGLRNRLYNYVVSVDRKITGDVEEPIVNSDNISVHYDNEVGVIGIDSIW